MSREELKKIIEDHKHWIMQDCYVGEKMRAHLTGANLAEANLSCTCLRYADLSGADLSGADLSGADLSGANLIGADLSGANLSCTYLRYAYLSGANLSGADLNGADLSGAKLNGADLINTDLRGAENVPFIPMACPDAGEFIAWKKASGKIVKLLIPDDAKRSSATSRKCRSSKAKVLSIENVDGTDSGLNSIASSFDKRFIYQIGETVEADDFCEDRFKECAAGIHFFINRQEAVDY